ncbi:anaerobic sulfatase maturase [Spirabiliibacterium falconis]|uniref:anaerobic sulfatase maturase n=1 Tax=Spirabiliibacterium falconis TaxID=572023 RepID=UPI001AAC48BB|nr:anaerobic sulfatase maturase [Spirabiliibacterium falconis]MBE2894695.1 anaerobic sulfatase maturase [Spirabiliibacterium falconis]
MAKPSSFNCNIKCEYCFYLEKEAVLTHKVDLMSDETLKAYVKNYIHSHAGETVDFAWQGGEPTLMGIDFYRKVVAYQKAFANGKTITNSFQTNGIAFNRQWMELFKQNHFLIGISVDGESAVHDKYRISINGQPTFERVKRGIALLKEYEVDFNTLTVINDQNWHKGVATYEALKELGSTFMQFIPIVEVANYDLTKSDYSPNKNARMAHFSVPREGYGRFLLDVFNHWVRRDVGTIFVREFDNLLGQWMGFPSTSCIHTVTCGKAVVIEANGDVYSCDHFVYPAYKIGNATKTSLTEIINSKKQVAFGDAKRDTLTKACEKCDVRLICHGGCPKHRIVPLKGEQHKHNYLCPSYQLFFRQTTPVMNRMRQIIQRGGSAADIMPMIR